LQSRLNVGNLKAIAHVSKPRGKGRTLWHTQT